jgi:hypothetical protein
MCQAVAEKHAFHLGEDEPEELVWDVGLAHRRHLWLNAHAHCCAPEPSTFSDIFRRRGCTAENM